MLFVSFCTFAGVLPLFLFLMISYPRVRTYGYIPICLVLIIGIAVLMEKYGVSPTFTITFLVSHYSYCVIDLRKRVCTVRI